MRHRHKGKVFGREKAPREAMMRNLAQSVILYEHVNTTLAKAKAVRPLVEKLITTGRTKKIAFDGTVSCIIRPALTIHILHRFAGR